MSHHGSVLRSVHCSRIAIAQRSAVRGSNAQRGPVEVDWAECDCIRQAEQFGHLVEEYRERFFT